MKGKTTIQVSRETKNLLAQLGGKNDTYDDIVRRALISLFNDENHWTWNVAMFNGVTQQESYIQIRVPKSIRKLAVDEQGLVSGIRDIMEDHDIEEIDDPRDGVVF